MLIAVAPGFVKVPIKPVQAGDKSLHIVLEKQGSARIRVFDKHDRLMTRYRVTVKRYFAAQDQIANVDIPAQQARPDRDGIFTVEGLNPDSYVFQVEASNHAKAFSDPFSVALGDESPLVEVHMNEGGTIEGIVVDSNRQPLPGVLVETLPNHIDDNPFTKMFRGMIPFKVTQQSTRTDARGAYRFKLLNPGTYQLKFTHPDHYDVSIKGHDVVAGQMTTIEAIRMQRGTVVSGTARVDGRPAAQIKVTITAISDAEAQAASMFNCEAVTGNDGAFVFDKRVPPGRYQVMAARQTLANPLLQIADFHKTKQEILLGPGQAQYNLTINIASELVPTGR